MTERMECKCGAYGLNRDGSKRFFPYEDMKIRWIRAEAFRWQEYGHMEIATSMRSVIKNGKLDVEAFRELKIWHEETIIFVDHSPDKDGFWSMDQLEKILETQKKIEPWLFEIFDRSLFWSMFCPAYYCEKGVPFLSKYVFLNCPKHRSLVKYE